MTTNVEVLVVGAGISGLLAATDLADDGRRVAVVDKGRGVGGRLATRRLGPDGTARVDHGAQFFTVRTERFRRFVDALLDHGVVHEWSRGFGDTPDGHPRYCVPGGMTTLAKRLAGPLDVTTGCRLTSVRADGHTVGDDGREWRAERVLLTSPVPQSVELLGGDAPDVLHRIRYDPTLCLLGRLDRAPGGLGSAGASQRPDGTPFEFVADNLAKGTSEDHALTAHLTGIESSARWDDPDDDVLAYLVDAVQPFLDGASLTDTQLMRWRYATPTVLHPEPMLVEGRLAFAGDAFGEARVEGAATSGWAAARALLD